MDEELKKWKDLFQQRQAEEIDTTELIKNFNQLEKKNRRDKILLTILFPVTVLLLISVVPSFASPYYLGAIILMTLAMLFMLLKLYKNRFSKIEDSENFSNKTFVTHQIQVLKNRILLTSRDMWIYAFLLIAGINVGYIEALQYFSIPARVGLHLGVSLMLIAGFYFGIKKKLKEYDREIVPLIQQLESFE
ncbi:MAG: hypothetical protein AAF573_17220 [Bacteroidota bacterium]